MPRCSIVIPVYNQAPITRQCLDTLRGQQSRDVDFEIVVVDDASDEPTRRLLAGYESRIRLVTHPTNAGFAQACNDGAAVASGEYLVFLNNDTTPQPGWLDALVAYADRHPAAGAVGSKLLFADHTIQHAGVVICQDRIPRHLYEGFPAEHPAVNRSRRFQVVTAACVLIPRPLFAQLDGFDTAYRNGWEDVDFCLRLGERGHEVHYCHESVLYHLECASRDPRSGQETHNRELYLRRWGHRVQPDDMGYYVDDGLLSLRYRELYPLQMTVSPLLGLLAETDFERQTDRLLGARSRQVFELLKENTRLHVRLEDAPGGSANGGPPRLGISPAVGSAYPVDCSEDSHAVTAPERELRALLLDAHDQLLERDGHLQTLFRPVASSGDGREGYEELVRKVRELVRSTLPRDAQVFVISKGDEELVTFEGRMGWHFPQTDDGIYPGYSPKESVGAIAQLEAAKARGGQFLVVPKSALWWLDHYGEFRCHLESRHRLVRQAEEGVIYSLTDAPRRSEDLVAQVRELIVSDLPDGAIVLVVSAGDERLLDAPGRRAWHFTQDGRGRHLRRPPADSAEAILQLKALRAKGAGFLLFPLPAFWWLDHYTVFRQYLDSRHRRLHSDDRCVLYELGASDGPEEGRQL